MVALEVLAVRLVVLQTHVLVGLAHLVKVLLVQTRLVLHNLLDSTTVVAVEQEPQVL
jgi:hypothetical protein